LLSAENLHSVRKLYERMVMVATQVKTAKPPVLKEEK
jgi:hypothetical protein